jgi:hypothetical protein
MTELGDGRRDPLGLIEVAPPERDERSMRRLEVAVAMLAIAGSLVLTLLR